MTWWLAAYQHATSSHDVCEVNTPVRRLLLHQLSNYLWEWSKTLSILHGPDNSVRYLRFSIDALFDDAPSRFLLVNYEIANLKNSEVQWGHLIRPLQNSCNVHKSRRGRQATYIYLLDRSVCINVYSPHKWNWRFWACWLAVSSLSRGFNSDGSDLCGTRWFIGSISLCLSGARLVPREVDLITAGSIWVARGPSIYLSSDWQRSQQDEPNSAIALVSAEIHTMILLTLCWSSASRSWPFEGPRLWTAACTSLRFLFNFNLRRLSNKFVELNYCCSMRWLLAD